VQGRYKARRRRRKASPRVDLNPNFREALLVVAGDGGFINSRRLGNWVSMR
jgi:hypothetical protein